MSDNQYRNANKYTRSAWKLDISGFHRLCKTYALRAWEGYPNGNLDYFLGPKGQREAMIDHCTKKFREAYGKTWEYTERQREIL